MHIVYLIERIDKKGGIQRSLTKRVNYLINNYNYKFTIVCTEKETGIPAYKIHESVNFIFLDNLNIKNSVIGRFLLRYRQSKMILKNLQPNILISAKYTLHNFFFKFINNKAKLISEIRETKELYNQINTLSLKSKIYRKTRDWVFKNQDILITLTAADKKNWGFNNIKVVPNPQTIQSDKVSNLNNKVVLALGRLHKIKGFDKLIDVWKIVNLKHPDWKLKICGEGEEYKNLYNKTIKLKLEKSIIFTNKFVSVTPELLNSSIFVLTSQFEAFGNVMVEAKVCGVPIVAFDAPNGPKEIIIENEDGFVVELNNIEQMAEKIIYLIENPNVRKKMGEKAKINSEKYDVETIVEKYNDIILS